MNKVLQAQWKIKLSDDVRIHSTTPLKLAGEGLLAKRCE